MINFHDIVAKTKVVKKAQMDAIRYSLILDILDREGKTIHDLPDKGQVNTHEAYVVIGYTDGKSAKEIAEEKGMSIKNVYNYRASFKNKVRFLEKHYNIRPDDIRHHQVILDAVRNERLYIFIFLTFSLVLGCYILFAS
jgi:hypothetical protein